MPLGGIFLVEPPPQEMKPKLVHAKSTKTGTAFFKPMAPNDLKNGDLIAKFWIITEPNRRPASVRLS
jgi:hypothetical protein